MGGIDVVNVIAPLGASRRKKVDRLLETLGPEGRKATDVAYTPHPQGAAAPSPASFPDLSPSAEELGDAKVFVNHLRITSPEDVQDAIQQIADARKGPLDAARRGVRSWGDTRQAAGERDAWADLMEQRAQRGEAIPTAERQLAMRELLCTVKPSQKSGTCSRTLSPSLRADLAPVAGMIQGWKAMRKPRLELREAQ